MSSTTIFGFERFVNRPWRNAGRLEWATTGSRPTPSQTRVILYLSLTPINTITAAQARAEA